MSYDSLIGKKFGKLTILGMVSGKRASCSVLCGCGTIKKVLLQSLKSGATKTCGDREKHPLKHGHYIGDRATPTINSYRRMLERCFNPSHISYKRYGGRGITVCDKWRGDNGFINFLEDMGERPGKEYSIDRINNDGNYEASNCRWATPREQWMNRSNTKLCREDVVEIRKLNLPKGELAKKYNITVNYLNDILRGVNWKNV